MTDVKRIEQLKRSAPMGAADIVIIALLAVGAVALAVFSLLPVGRGSEVAIAVAGNTRRYPLSEDAEIKLDSLTVVIEGGEVYVRDSACPDKICEHTGRISRVHEKIVCLPAGVIVSIEGESEFDLTTGGRT